jgi:hypothetical protein
LKFKNLGPPEGGPYEIEIKFRDHLKEVPTKAKPTTAGLKARRYKFKSKGTDESAGGYPPTPLF